MDTDVVTLFLAGDLMTGRGVDQILRHPSAPGIHEEYVKDARGYVDLADEHSGTIPRGVEPSYIWGDALAELERAQPHARIVNLETSVTRSEACWPKGINYRMSPGNIDCLTVPRLDVCCLANNHVLDFGVPGLLETLDTLRAAGIRTVGAGRDLAGAQQPAAVELPYDKRVVVFALGSRTSGVPPVWAATSDGPGVDYLDDLSEASASVVVERVRPVRRPGTVVVVSIHWGSNWGYGVPPPFIRFAHTLVDGGVDVVYGHSSHHVRPLEIYRDRLILYGCGDFLDDYEGISGYEQYRGDLALMYFPTVDAATGRFIDMRMVPMQIRRMRLSRASPSDQDWLAGVVNVVSRRFGVTVQKLDDGALGLRCASGRLAPDL